MDKQLLYKRIASILDARESSGKAGNEVWFDRHSDELKKLVKDHMPSGSGWDNGTTLDFERSTGEKLVFVGGYHHMNEHGFYDGWTDHTVTCRASLIFDFTLTVSGRNRNDVKELLYQIFDHALRKEV